MYIKPALPCLPFFVVFSINLSSRPEWEGNDTVKGVGEPNCHIVQTEKKASKPTTTIKLTRKLRDY